MNYSESNKFTWWKNEEFFYGFLNQILIELENASNEKLQNFVIEKFNQNITPKRLGYSERRAYVDLLNKIGQNKISFDGAKLISGFAEYVNTLDSLKDFSKLKNVFSKQYEEYVSTEEFNEKIESVVENEIENTEINKYESLIEELKEIELSFDYLLDEEISELSRKHNEYEAKIDAKFDVSDFEYEAREYEEEMEKEEQYISDLFDGLTEE